MIAVVIILSVVVLLLSLEVRVLRCQRKELEKYMEDQDNDAPWNAVADRHINKACTRL